MKTEVQLLLQQTPEEYQMMVFNLWFNWCDVKTSNIKSLHKAITSQPLFNWWKKELLKLELIFLKEIDPYSEVVSKEVAKSMYDDYTHEVFKRFSKIKNQNQNATTRKN